VSADGDHCFQPILANTRIDLLVLFTTEAMEELGGSRPCVRLAEHCIDHLNQTILVNSGVPVEFRLVDVAEIKLNEVNDFEKLLHTLKQGDEVVGFSASKNQAINKKSSAYRDDVGADLVCLFVKAMKQSGAAWAMTKREQAFEKYAFSVVNQYASVINYSVAHEIGHNFGCGHDRNNKKGPSLEPYAYGHTFKANGDDVGTVMCEGPGRIPLFSNPTKQYLGVPTGIAVGLPNEAHNAKVMTDSAPFVANFRKQTLP
jgi:peptidyl-Asp metalloendopeptidase